MINDHTINIKKTWTGRVSTDLEKSGNLKVREFATDFQKSGNFVASLKFVFSQVEDPNFEKFWRACPQTPLNGLTVELYLGLEKSLKSQGISCCLESGNRDQIVNCRNKSLSAIQDP